jgi:PAS domain S-box-containing protein
MSDISAIRTTRIFTSGGSGRILEAVVPPGARVFIAVIALLALGAVALLVAVADGSLVERPLLVAAVALLIGLEHLFGTRLVRRGPQGETTTHEEAYIVALALLEPAPAVVAAVALGFALGSVLMRREPLKAIFNVSAMTLAAAVAMLVVEALGGGTSSSGLAVIAVAAGAVVFALVNRLSVSGVLALVGAGNFRGNLRDEPAARAFLLAANVAIGLLAGLAARDDLWVLPLGLAALVVVHYTFAGHGRAKAERQKLADIVDASSDGILTLDRSGRVASWSAACVEMTGYDEDEVFGLSFEELTELLEGERVHSPHPGAGRRYAGRIRTKHGEARWLLVARTRLPEGGDVLVVHDDTARRSFEEVRAAQLEDRMWSDLIASVSHELRTPLTSILGFTQTLLTRPLADEERKRYLRIIAEQAHRLEMLVGDLLSLRTLEEAGLELQLDELDLRELLEEQAAAFESQLTQHELRLELPGEPLVVRADRRRVAQVVGNLLSNALKYSPEGGTVSLKAERRDGHFVISVADEGIGIPEESRHDVFLPFFRVEQGMETDGTGLGLAISRRIVRRHGGEMDFQSTPGKGSTFTFELPLEPPEG